MKRLIDIVVALAMAALAALRKGELGRMRMGAIDKDGFIHWHDEPKTHSRIQWVTVRVDRDGNEVRR